MKYTKETVRKIEQALQDGEGRVNAVKQAGIHYQTFMDWMKDDKKPEFSERIKKAEETGNDQIKDICKRRIITDKSWQSAAWWLERNFPTEFRNRQEVAHGGQLIVNTTEEGKKGIENILNDND